MLMVQPEEGRTRPGGPGKGSLERSNRQLIQGEA